MILKMRQDDIQDETCHFLKTTRGICLRRVITRDVAVEIPISWIIQVP